MVNARLRETARLAFFFASPRHFNFVNCKTETSKRFKSERETFRLNSSRGVKQRTLWFLRSFLDAPLSFLTSFCELAGTGNSTSKLVMIY